MKVDPNQPINFQAEYILCENGQVFLHDGSSARLAELGNEGSAFRKFCQSLDPNKCFIAALIPDDADRAVFFRAREVAGAENIHLQATVDTPERHRQMWASYQMVQRTESKQEEQEHAQN